MSSDPANPAISPSDPVGSELVRIADAEIDLALEHAQAIATEPSESIHQCRKSLKRLRALARLAKGNKDSDWRAIDSRLGDAGRLLSASRDASVLGHTMNRLASASGPPAIAPGIAALASAETKELILLLQALKPDLDAFLGDREADLPSLYAALESSYRECGKRLERYAADGHPEQAHDWRKAVQRFANQLVLFAGLIPDTTDELLPSLHELAGLLGEYQDLSVFCRTLQEGGIDAISRSGSELLARARSLQHDLAESALPLGKRLFLKKKHFLPKHRPESTQPASSDRESDGH